MFKKIWRGVKRVVKTVVRVVKDVVQRVIGVLDFVASLLGLRIKKTLRLKVWILKNDKGYPIVSNEVAEAWVAEAKRIFLGEAKIEIRPANIRAEQIVNVLGEQPPAFAIRPDISPSDMLTEEVDWFDEHRTYAHTSSWQYIADTVGYGEPIFAFIVDDITNSDQSLGVANTWWNFCVVAKDAKLSTLAHELGHVCGLFHRSQLSNLMTPQRTGTSLTRWQESVIRNSRYVTLLRD